MIPGHSCRGVGKWSGRKETRGRLIEQVTIWDNWNFLENDLEHIYLRVIPLEWWGSCDIYTVMGKGLLRGMLIPWYFWEAKREQSGLMSWWKAVRQRKAGAGSWKCGMDYSPRRWLGHKQYLRHSTLLCLPERSLRYACSSLFVFIGPTVVVELKEIYTKSLFLRYCHVFQT